MAGCGHRLPHFRSTCLGVGAVFVLIASGELLQGVSRALDGFGVPPHVLASAHYHDAMVWVFVHMLVKGLIIAVVGHYAQGERLRRAFARVMVVAMAIFAMLDIRTSDSPLGNGLYAGARSLVPPIMGLIILALFLHLALCRAAVADPKAG